MKVEYAKVKGYITKDKSLIKELLHPNIHGKEIKQSLAEATIPVGGKTILHKHIVSEEIYYILQGKGIMTLGKETFEVKEKDTIYIPPKTPHKIENTGTIPLKILCCCYPAYSHDDTELLE